MSGLPQGIGGIIHPFPGRASTIPGEGQRLLIASVIGCVLAVAGANQSQAGGWAFAGLGSLADPGGSRAFGISGDGSVVVGYSDDQAFRWTEAEGMVGLGLASSSKAYDASTDGSVIVGHVTMGGTNMQAFRWTDSEGMVGLGWLDPSNTSSAYAVSADGSVVVGISGVWGYNNAFRWTANGGMDKLPIGFASATGVSASGSVVVGKTEPLTGQGMKAWRWTQADDKVTYLDANTLAMGVSADGSTAEWERIIHLKPCSGQQVVVR